jgi:hypothetical protein
MELSAVRAPHDLQIPVRKRLTGSSTVGFGKELAEASSGGSGAGIAGDNWWLVTGGRLGDRKAVERVRRRV